jgi:DNA-binding PadR family transcriptional regulator
MKTKRELPRTPLALAVMNLLNERPMHPYEMKSKMKERGHDQVVKLAGGSIYDTVERLEKGGFIKSQAPSREGRRPERTVYEITAIGREEITAWLRELIAEPEHEYPQFAAALAFFAALEKDEVIHLLRRRTVMLESRIATTDTQLKSLAEDMHLPRLFMVEGEYGLAMDRAELDWVRALIRDIQDGKLWITHEEARAFEEAMERNRGGENG